jgi:class 3 adenylate cyclase
VEMLSQLFTAFDKECSRLNLYKVYTIGDCYVVMGFLDNDNRKSPEEEANDVTLLAISMIETINRLRAKLNITTLNMRIGIHTVGLFILHLGRCDWRGDRNRSSPLRHLWRGCCRRKQNGVRRTRGQN